MRLILLAIALIPKPPELCVNGLVLDSYFCPDSDVRYIFTERLGCYQPKVVAEVCADLPAEDPETLAPPPEVDPDFDEFGPGPQPGPPGADPVDKPDA